VDNKETIQLTIDESLLAEAEQAARALDMSRSDFISAAVQRALRQRETIALERKHAQGYADHLPDSDETDEWENEREWGKP
jgi:metal-responsive CopG/Arc/MetJ family transcriptional regulator